MASKLSSLSDGWLWFGLGIFTVFAVHGVSHGLQHIRALTVIHRPSSPRTLPSPHPTRPEDAIKTSSLLTLASSHNTDIRASATKILCSRFYASDSAKRLLIQDLNSKDDDVRRRAQLAFNLLCEIGVWREYSVPPPTPRGGWRFVERRGGAVLRDGAERDLRRRHREAVVIHEGEGAVGREDVYMRDGEGMMSTEEERINFEIERLTQGYVNTGTGFSAS